MLNDKSEICFDFYADRISSSTLRENCGLAIMRLAAKATRPVNYRGLSHLNRLISRMLPSNGIVNIQMSEDTLFQFPYGDGYWGRLLDNQRPYSLAEESFLLAISDIDYAYIDCGANFGYMSSLVTGQKFGSKPAIAIEADPENYQMLLRNWRTNDCRFDTKNRAIFSTSGKTVTMADGKHEARSIRFSPVNQRIKTIETLRLDDLNDWVAAQQCKELIVKLDIEGTEIDALKGARKLLKKLPLIMFEDHGNDPTHAVSRYLQKQMSARIFVSEKRGCREIVDLNELFAIKRSEHVGYDFMAAKGDFWPERILSLRYTKNNEPSGIS